ncbi:MAG: undecaprenyl/decaprenyl-phosphate alpha-N-acetylglucosaminyl 1-phosphate transferase [Thermomicrobiales bacterium]|nr:undecaprenyl/decaprenyl-phosphate alpha-N-acetylglucosaminyl 1-phosphate transferase [Thermomicrobiales bacterium]
MTNELIALVLFALTVAISYSFVSLATSLFEKWGLVDQPGPMRVNKNVVARGLGVAIFLAYLVGIGLSFSLPVERFPEETERILLMIIGMAIVVAVMLVDDAIDLSPRIKLIWQVVAALMIILPRFQGENHGIVIEQLNVPWLGVMTIPLAIGVVATLLWLVGMMNVMNWVDGLDGLAASISLTACTVMFIHTFWGFGGYPQFTISLLPLLLGAAVIGFLPFNWYPSRVIMGDAGAMFLGFTLGVISIIGGAKIGMMLLVLGFPILDGIWVTMNRLMNGKQAMTRDMRHLHHRLLRAGFSQPQVVLIFTAVSSVFGAAALLLPNRELKLVAIVILGAFLLVVLWWLARHPEREVVSQENSEALT